MLLEWDFNLNAYAAFGIDRGRCAEQFRYALHPLRAMGMRQSECHDYGEVIWKDSR